MRSALLVRVLVASHWRAILNGYLGLAQSSHKDNFSPVVFWLLIGGAVVCALCIALKKYGLASAVVTAASGVSVALFVHKCYWYVVDVLYGIDEKQFDRLQALIRSMTPKERENPDIINPSRKRRIAAGSGQKVEDVNRLLNQHKQMQKLFKQFNGKGSKKKMRRMGFNPSSFGM